MHHLCFFIYFSHHKSIQIMIKDHFGPVFCAQLSSLTQTNICCKISTTDPCVLKRKHSLVATVREAYIRFVFVPHSRTVSKLF